MLKKKKGGFFVCFLNTMLLSHQDAFLNVFFTITRFSCSNEIRAVQILDSNRILKFHLIKRSANDTSEGGNNAQQIWLYNKQGRCSAA